MVSPGVALGYQKKCVFTLIKRLFFDIRVWGPPYTLNQVDPRLSLFRNQVKLGNAKALS
jgi:hypothetical protein